MKSCQLGHQVATMPIKSTCLSTVHIFIQCVHGDETHLTRLVLDTNYEALRSLGKRIYVHLQWIQLRTQNSLNSIYSFG